MNKISEFTKNRSMDMGERLDSGGGGIRHKPRVTGTAPPKTDRITPIGFLYIRVFSIFLSRLVSEWVNNQLSVLLTFEERYL